MPQLPSIWGLLLLNIPPPGAWAYGGGGWGGGGTFSPALRRLLWVAAPWVPYSPWAVWERRAPSFPWEPPAWAQTPAYSPRSGFCGGGGYGRPWGSPRSRSFLRTGLPQAHPPPFLCCSGTEWAPAAACPPPFPSAPACRCRKWAPGPQEWEDRSSWPCRCAAQQHRCWQTRKPSPGSPPSAPSPADAAGRSPPRRPGLRGYPRRTLSWGCCGSGPRRHPARISGST